jgi:hypothetical protein
MFKSKKKKPGKPPVALDKKAIGAVVILAVLPLVSLLLVFVSRVFLSPVGKYARDMRELEIISHRSITFKHPLPRHLTLVDAEADLKSGRDFINITDRQSGCDVEAMVLPGLNLDADREKALDALARDGIIDKNSDGSNSKSIADPMDVDLDANGKGTMDLLGKPMPYRLGYSRPAFLLPVPLPGVKGRRRTLLGLIDRGNYTPPLLIRITSSKDGDRPAMAFVQSAKMCLRNITSFGGGY